MQTKTTFLPTQSNRSFVTHTHTNAHTPALWSVFESHSLLISANKFHSFVCSRAAISEREGGNGGVMCVWLLLLLIFLLLFYLFRSAIHTSLFSPILKYGTVMWSYDVHKQLSVTPREYINSTTSLSHYIFVVDVVVAITFPFVYARIRAIYVYSTFYIGCPGTLSLFRL